MRPAVRHFALAASRTADAGMQEVADRPWGFPWNWRPLLVAPTALDDFAAAVAEVRSETWNYREDLSLIPAQ